MNKKKKGVEFVIKMKGEDGKVEIYDDQKHDSGRASLDDNESEITEKENIDEQ